MARINPFVFMLLLYFLSLLLPGNYSLWNQLKYSQEIRKQKREIAYLEKEIKQSTKALEELQFEEDMLEKYAREKYLMKAPDEDIYLLR
ncbi:MAG: septum formation initiator family protein [Porphyromonas sp.]|nr:septum formation initiator family protein [Porphyromonas sp.]